MLSRNEKVNIVVTAKDKASKTLSGISGKVAGIGAAYLGWKGITSILSSIIEKGQNWETVWNDVNASLERHGQAIGDNIGRIQDFADKMQTFSGTSDEVIGKAVQRFVDYGQSADEAMESVRVVIDMTAGTGQSLMTVTDLLSKAAAGYTSTLSRYGIILDESIPKEKKYAAALEKITAMYGGAAAARADTYAVRISMLTERFGDLQEKLFTLLLPALGSFIDVGSSVISVASKMASGMQSITKWLISTKDVTEGAGEAGDKFDYWQVQLGYLNKELASGKITLSEYSTALGELGKVRESFFTKEEVNYMFAMDTAIAMVSDRLGEDFIPGLREARMAQEELKVAAEQSRLQMEALETALENTGIKLVKATGAEARESLSNLGVEFVDLSGIVSGFTSTTESLGLQLESNIQAITENANISNMIWEASLIGYDERTQAMMQLDREYDATHAEILEAALTGDVDYNTALLALDKITAKKREKIEKGFQGERSARAKKMEEYMSGLVRQGVVDMADSFVEGRKDFAEIFKGIAKDFLKYFIVQSLLSLKVVFIAKFISMLAGIFDTPKYDKVAMTQGEHFVQWFTRGVQNEFARMDMGTQLSGSMMTPLTAGVSGGGGVTVNNYNGVVTEDFIDRDVLPSVSMSTKLKETEIFNASKDVWGGSLVYNS